MLVVKDQRVDRKTHLAQAITRLMQRCTERNQTRCKRGNSCSRTSNGRAASKRLPCKRRVDAGDSLERVTHFAAEAGHQYDSLQWWGGERRELGQL